MKRTHIELFTIALIIFVIVTLSATSKINLYDFFLGVALLISRCELFSFHKQKEIRNEAMKRASVRYN